MELLDLIELFYSYKEIRCKLNWGHLEHLVLLHSNTHPSKVFHMPSSLLLHFLLLLNLGERGQWLFFYPSFLLSRMSAMLRRNPALLTLVWDKRYSLLCSPC